MLIYPSLGSHQLSGSGLSEGGILSAQNNRLVLQNSVRTALIQAAGGVAVLTGAIVAWRQLHQTASDAQAQRKSDRQALLLEHFSKAIQYLGDDTSGIRLGGVYLLGMLAEESPMHRNASRDALSSFTRSRSPWPPNPPRPPIGIDPRRLADLGAQSPDIQGALSVLGKGLWVRSCSGPLHLNNCDLRRAELSEAYFQGADFGESHLERASLIRTQMIECSLRNADLSGADLSGANLWATDIRGTVFTGTVFSDIKLTGALFDYSTVWPNGFSLDEAERLGAQSAR